MNLLLAVFLVKVLHTGLKAIQQRQVMRAEYWRMPVISLLMACAEVFYISSILREAFGGGNLLYVAVAMGLGSGVGAIIGTWIHKGAHRD